MAGVFEQLGKRNGGILGESDTTREIRELYKNAPFKYNYDQGMYDQIKQEELTKEADNLSVPEAAYHGFASATGSVIRAAGNALNYYAKPSYMTEEQWDEQARQNGLISSFTNKVNKGIEEYGKSVEDAHAMQYSDPLGANALAGGIASVVPYLVALGISAKMGGPTAGESVLAQGIATKGAAQIAPLLAKISSKYGPKIAANSAKYTVPILENLALGQKQALPEAMVEGISSGKLDYVEEARANGTYVAGQTEQEAEQVAMDVLADNLMFITATDTLQDALMLTLGRSGAGKAMKALTAGGVGGFINAIQEMGQQIIPKAAMGKDWSLTDTDVVASGVIGALTGGVPTAVYEAAGKVMGNESPEQPTTQQPTQEATPVASAPTPAAAEEPKVDTSKITPADAKVFLEGYRDSESTGAEYAEIDEILDSGDEAAIVKKAAELGFGQTAQTAPTPQKLSKPVEPPAPTPAPAEPPVETTPAPATPEVTPWNGEKVKIGKAELSPVVSDDGQIVIKGSKDLTNNDKKAMKKNGIIWDTKKQAYVLKDTSEGRKWLGGYAIAGTKAAEPIKEEAVKPKEKIGGFNFVEQDKETGLIWLASATNPNKLAILGKDKKGFKAVVFNKGEIFKDKFQKFKTLEEAEAYIANYKDEAPVEHIKEEAIKEEGVKEENVKEEAPAGEGTPDKDNADGNTGEPVKPIKPTTVKKKWKGGHILVGGVEMAPLHDKETDTINIELPAGRELSDAVRAELETAGMQETSKGSWKGLNTDKLQSFLETGELAFKEKEKDTVSFMKKKFKKKVGKYKVDEQDDNTDSVHNYIHSDDDGENGSRWLTLEKKNGKLAVSMGYVGGPTEKTAEFATLDEAEQYVKDNELPPKAKEVKEDGGKENTDKDNGNEDKGGTPEPKPVKTAEADGDTGKGENSNTEGLEDNATPLKPATPPAVEVQADENGVKPLVKGMGAEEAKTRIAENDKAAYAAAEKLKKQYDDGELTAEEARTAISELTSKYNKGKTKPVSKETLNKMAQLRKDITAAEKAKKEAPKLEAKKATEEAIAAGEQLVKEACDRIIADEKQPLDDDIWMEATKAINEKLGAAGLKLLSKTKKEDLERKYRMMLVDAKKEASNIQKQYYDIRDMFDAETKNIYNSVYDGKLDAQKGLEQYNKLKEKFEADVKEIGRKPDRYVIDTLYGTRGKFIEAMTNPKSKAYLFVKLDKSLEGIVKDFKQERLYAREMVSDQPIGATAKVIQEYQNKIEAAYKEYLSDISEAGKEPTSSAEKRYKESLDAIDSHIKALYPQEYLSHLTSVMAYDEDVDNAIRLYKDKKISASEALERVKKLNDEYKDVFTETKTFTSRSGLYLETEYGPESFAEQATRNLEKLQYLIAERGEATPSNPTSLEGNNFGEYTDSIMGAGTIEAIFGGTNVIKERVTETPNPKDQAIVDAMVEEKVADDADKKDPIEGDNVISKIDKIIAAKKDSRTTDYFRKHYDVKLKIKEALEKGVSALYYTEYKAKNGKGSQTKYYYTLAGDDTLHDDMKGVAIRVMAELAGNADGPMKIVPINLKEYKQKINEKYLKELPSDEDSFEEFGDWLYGWYGDDEDLDIKATQTILEKEYTEENPCPLNSLYKEKHDTIINEIWGGDWTFKSLGDFVRKATIINTAYGELNDQYNIIIDEESLSDLQDDEREAVIRYADWWDEQVKSKPQDYPIRHRFTKEVTEETLISDEALSKKIKTEGEQHEEDFHEKTADEADADAEANLAKAEEFARNVATADALDKAKAKQKEKIAKAEKEGKRVSEVATVSEEDTARIKAAKAEALAALNVATDEINALYKADSNEQVPLENFKSSIIKQIVHAGYIVMKNAGQKLYKDWRSSMEELVDSMKGLKDQGKAYAKRVLDSAWDFITNLPERVSFAADKLKDTLDNIGMALDIALAGNDRGFGQKETETMLQANNQPLYNRVKDYLASAFKALVRYPRRGIDNHGGEDNVDVRTPEQYVEGDSGRRNGNGLEANTGNTGRGSQMGSGTATDRQTGSEVQVYGTAGDNTEKTSSPVPRGGTAAGGEQGNLQGGKEEPNDKTGLPRDTNKSGSDRTGNGRGSKLPTKRTKNNRNVSKDNAGPQGSDVASKTISQLRQQFNNSPFKPADEKGIAEAVPNLLPEQIQDEVAIERRLWTNNGKGMLVANGTGTGKTVVGLAQVVRCIQKGAKKILIVVPNSTVKDRWVDDAKLVGLPKDVFATITSGEVVDDKINFVSYKSFSDNKNILDQSWDFVIMDEAHTVSGGQDNADYIGFRTQNAQTLRAITGHERTGFDDYMWSKYRDKYNRLYGKDGLVEAEAQAYKDLDASLNSPAAGQDLINENRAKHAQLKKELDALTIELEVLKDKERPKYEKRLLARKEDTRVLLLSATPFAYGNNIYYAEGLLFNYEKDYNDFMVNKLGYVLQDENSTVDIRRNMDKSPNPDHDAEVRFHDELIKSGAMINRRLEVPQDYNRRFIKVNGGIGQEIDAGFDYINEKYSASGLNKAFIDHFKYASLCRLLEAIKAEAAVPMIREYVKQGKKVVLFHDYIKEAAIPHPFVLSNVEQSKLSDEARAAYKKFCEEDEEGKRLQALPFNGAKLADKIIEEAFGSSAVIVNGDVSPSKRKARVDAFNNADSGVNIISVSTAAGKEGISLHDKIKDGEGNSLRSVPRVLINIGMPTRPTDAIQTEGRIYRLGQQSNAMFRYLYTDTHTERQAYTKYISTRTSTVEHLALGNQARNLEATFSYGYLESLGYDTNFNAAQDTMNTGGKALDNMSDEEVNATLKKIRKALSGKKGMTEETLAKLDKQIQDLDDRINEQKRSEILTPENEAKTVNAIKNAVNGGKVTKVKDGVYVVTLPNGANLWFDLNESQVAILSRMSDDQKKRMMSAHDIRNSGYVIRGAYTQKYMPQHDGVMNLVKLTEAATQHTVDHEVYHFVQKMLLSPSELAKVMDYWKYILKKDIGADAYNQLSEKEILDRCLEMDADMHANFMAYERKPKNFIERVAWKVTKWLANFANKFGIDTPAGMYLRTASGEMFRRRDNLTSEEIAQRIRDVGIKPTKMAKTLYQTAWHGTPHVFDEFSTSKIGEGEGGQAHGWGLYFAANRSVSEEYRERLSNIRNKLEKIIVNVNGEHYTVTESDVVDENGVREQNVADSEGNIVLEKDNPLLFKTIRDIANYGGPKEAISEVKNLIQIVKGFGDVEREKEYKARLKMLETEFKGAEVEYEINKGSLFKVNIPENDVLLDENKVFERQPFRVRRALERVFSDIKTTPNPDANLIKGFIREFKQDNQQNVDKLLHNIEEQINRFNTVFSTLSKKPSFQRALHLIGSPLHDKEYSQLRRRFKNEIKYYVWDFIDKSTEGLDGKTLERHQIEDGWVFDQGFYDEWSDNDLQTARIEYARSIIYSLTESKNFASDGSFLSIFPTEKAEPEKLLAGKKGYEILDELERALGSPKAASLSMLKQGIKGIHYIGQRDGECFVVFDDNAVSIKERYDLTLQNNKDLIERSYKECEDEMRKAFPNGKFTPIDANRWLVELKGGARYEIDIKDRIIVNAAEEAKARKDHGLKGKAGEVAITGKYQGITEDIVDGVISLSRKSAQGTGYHEVYHAAWDAVLNEKEKAALIKEYEAQAKAEGRNVQEVIADAVMSNTLKRQANDSRILSRVKQRVLDFAYALKALFTRMENVHNVMRKIEQGEVWNRTPNEMQEATGRYTAANKYKENLIALHNLTAENLSKILFGENKGKLISPSLAVMPDTFSYNSYGEITLVGDKNMINPETGAARVYTGDAWTPTVPQPKIVDGEQVFYNKATKKNIPYTIENIEKYMLEEARQQLKADASKIANEQMLAAVLVDRLNTIDDMHEAVQKLTNKGDYSPDNLQQTLKLVKGSTAGNQFLQAILNVLQNKNPKAVDLKDELRNQGVKISSGNMWLLNAAEQLLDQARNIKFGYLEAKVQRTVDISEFRAAVVPQSLMKTKEVQELERRGIEVFSYKDGSVKQRKEAVDLALEITGEQFPVMFQAIEAAEQPDGTMMFSITPMDEVDGKGMPDDLKNVVNAPDSVGASVDSKATKKDLDKLLVAKMMKEQGKTREEIFDKTGWWADKNGNWSLTKPKDSGEKEKPSKDAKKPYNWQKPNLDKATEEGDNSIEPAPEATQEPKQYKNVGEVMEDAQKNADDAQTTGEIRVKDTSMTPREKNKTVGFFDSLIGSPSELAKKYPVFRSFYRIYQKAEEVQEKLRSRWRKQFQSDIAELKSNDDMDAYLDIMLDGELKQKEYTLAELKEQGIADNVARAYTRTRQLIRNIWESVNDAHRGVTVRIDKLNGKSIKELKEKPFEENIMVRESSDAAFVPLEKAELKDDVEYEVKHSRPHVYRSQQILTKEQLDTLRNSPYANVSNVEEHKVKGVDAVMYRANIERVAAPIGKITGYLPHIFEQWLVMVNTDEGPQIVGSGQSLDLALQEAKRLKEQTKGNVDFYIAPKIFDPSGVYDGDVADGKKGNPNITLSAQDFAKLEKSLRDTFNLSMAEAEEALGKVAKRESRSRFLGNLRYRKGRVGYNSDVINTLDRYISMTSRYVALQPAKRRAVNLFERTFGPLDKDYSGKDSMAVTVRRYMRYCNGTPNFLESWITSQLNKMDWWKRKVSSQYGDRTLMALAGKANGLLSMSLLGCFNISSAVVGLTQLINTYGLIGGRYLGEGMAAVQRMNLRDKRILTEAGIPYNIGLDTPSGFTKRRERIDSATAFGNMRRMLSYAGNKGMYFFKQADRLTRNATTLGAYYKAIADGKTHKQAIEYAKDINRRSNFSYGAADAAGIFQWTAGTGFGELSLLFQKYPMKEWELMKSMMPIIGSSTKAEKARFWGAYFLMAGLAGIPAGEWLDWLIETLFGIKPSAAFKSVLFKEYGDTPFTRTVAYGIGANAGVDISRRVGMANMIPDSASMWGYLFGPAGNITERMIRSAASQDYAKAIKAVSPVMGNLAEAVIHGYSTNSKGQINYMYNDVEKVLKSMGFRTVGESMDSDLRTAVYLDKQSRKDDRQKVMMEMVKKRIDGEALTPEDYKALREQGITGAQFQKAVKAAKMTALQRTRASMTKQQKKDFAGTIVMEDDE